MVVDDVNYWLKIIFPASDGSALGRGAILALFRVYPPPIFF
jgi:hypothetical protein